MVKYRGFVFQLTSLFHRSSSFELKFSIKLEKFVNFVLVVINVSR